MLPRLFEIPLGFATIPINSYGILVMIGFLAGLWVAGRRAPQRGLSPELVSDLSVWLLVGGLIGARIVYVVFYNRWDEAAHAWEFDFRLFDLADGGIHPLGAIAGFAAAAAWRWRRRPPRSAAAAPAGAGPEAKPSAPPPTKPGAWATVRDILWMLAGAAAGGRVLHLVLHRADYNFKVFAIWEGGIVFYGGFIAAIAAGIGFLLRRRAPVLVTADVVAPSLALGMAFGRLGCFSKGCCWGAISRAPWALQFPRITETVTRDGRTFEDVTGSPPYLYHRDVLRVVGGRDAWSLPVHPVQLYESAAMVALFLGLSWYWRRAPRPGRVLGGLGVGYGAWRFAVEFLRGDAHPRAFELNFSQIVSLGVTAAGALLWALAPRGAVAPTGGAGVDSGKNGGAKNA